MDDELRSKHREAMAFANRAYMARIREENVEALALSRKAHQLEKEAAFILLNQYDAEPTRSILFRSAATLALDCGEIRDAERLIGFGLSGDGPPEIMVELRDLLERVHFNRHLETRGIVLESNDLQMSLEGPVIADGFGEFVPIFSRLNFATRAIHRCADRKYGFPYSEQPQTTRKNITTYVSTPRSGCFAMSIRVAKEQLSFEDARTDFGLIHEFIECLRLYEDENEDALRELIGSDDYFCNFIALARHISPDGRDVKMVGFTAPFGGSMKTAALTKHDNRLFNVRRNQLPERANAPLMEATEVTVEGRLEFADRRRRKQPSIQIEQSSGRYATFVVPKGLMNDIVRPLWDQNVRARGVREGKKIILTKIDPLGY